MLNTQKLVKNKRILIFAAAFSLTAVIFLLAQILAAANVAVFEAEDGSPAAGAQVAADTNSSGGSYIEFASIGSEPPPDPDPPPGDEQFFEDFNGPGGLERFDFDIYHRDDVVVSMESWEGDHDLLGNGDCTPPTQTHTITRGPDRVYNDEWIYHCESIGGDTNKGHLMTSIASTAGYSIGGFAPKQTFTDVNEIRWDVNITDLGIRQWIEIAVIPEANFDFQKLPCGLEGVRKVCSGEGISCPGNTHCPSSVKAVGALFGTTEGQPHIYLADDSGSQREEPQYAQFKWDKPWNYEDDPARDEAKTRRKMFLKEDTNGNLVYGIETPDGSFYEKIWPGALPNGRVRVVFKDHAYTPDKNPAPASTYIGEWTWHWDNISIK